MSLRVQCIAMLERETMCSQTDPVQLGKQALLQLCFILVYEFLAKCTEAYVEGRFIDDVP